MILDFDKAYEKQPSEQKTIRLELAEVASSLIVSGYALNAAEIKIFDSTGEDASDDMVEGEPTLDATNYYVYVFLKNGEDQADYFLRLKTTWTKDAQPDQKDERDLLIKVRAKGF
jgi:hypothetical protein